MIPLSANIHASCVALGKAADAFGAPCDAGILLLGNSGAGKSDLALRLIARGAVLVCDDRCELFLAGHMLQARPPPQLAGLIEIRGVGIVAFPYAAEARIALAARLVPPGAVARLPEPAWYRPPEILAAPRRVWPPEIAIAPFEVSAPEKIVAAASAFARDRFREEIDPA